ncbi:MAG: hypothetical protein U0R18_13665 [Mycobacterium sp.]
MHIVDLDAVAVRAVAGQFDAVAQLVAVATPLTFGASTAGRRYPSEGEAVRRLCALRADELSDWARAARTTSIELRSATQYYAESERVAAARMG